MTDLLRLLDEERRVAAGPRGGFVRESRAGRPVGQAGGPLACGLTGEWWPVRKLTAVAGSAGFLVIAPGVVAGLVPWWLTQWSTGSRR